MTIAASQSSERSTTRSFALGIGLTNECNLACSFCYRDPTPHRSAVAPASACCDGEPAGALGQSRHRRERHASGLPDAAGSTCDAQPIKLTITSNGYSIAVLDDAQVTAFKDVEFSLDYPTEAEQDRQRGAGNWRLIHQQAARCRAARRAGHLHRGDDALELRPPRRHRATLPRPTMRRCASTSISRSAPTPMRSLMRSIGAASRRCSRPPT